MKKPSKLELLTSCFFSFRNVSMFKILEVNHCILVFSDVAIVQDFISGQYVVHQFTIDY